MRRKVTEFMILMKKDTFRLFFILYPIDPSKSKTLGNDNLLTLTRPPPPQIGKRKRKQEFTLAVAVRSDRGSGSKGEDSYVSRSRDRRDLAC